MKTHILKLSNTHAKGSYADRIKSAQNFNEQLFSKIYPMYEDSDFTPIRNIEKVYKQLLPEPIYFNIRKLNRNESKKFAGGFITFFNLKNKVSKYEMVLPAKKDQFHISNLSTFMHESMHLLNFITSPKYFRVSEKIREKELEDISHKIYSKYLYNNKGYSYFYTNRRILKRTKKETKKAIAKLPAEDKLLILNHLKESIKGEIAAFDETQKYAKILKKDKREYKWIDADGYFKSYMFKQKLDIINKIIYQIISSERKTPAQGGIAEYIKRLIKSASNLCKSS